MRKRDSRTGPVLMVCLLFVFINTLVYNANAQNEASILVSDLQAEYFTNPVGIDDSNPRLSWKIYSSERNTSQTAYQIQVSEVPDFSSVIWDTERKESDQSIQLEYAGPKLESRKRYYWRTRIWNNHGNQSEWSRPAFWEMGLLNSADWQAGWIEPGFEQDTSASPPNLMFRNEFELDGEVLSARAYVTSHGIYEMEINGKKVGDQVFAPGWTSYHNRLQYQTYDVTDLLQNGENAVGVMLGDGWYRGFLAWGDARNHYGKTLGLLAQIEVTYDDGSTEIIGTDENWKSSTGPILKSDIYNGETYDARLEKEGWSETGYDSSDWSMVEVANHTKENLLAPEAPPVRKIQELKPLDILQTPEGDTVVDFGQNMVGWVRIKAEGARGTEITLKHAEVLDKDGNFYTANIRAADQTNTYILKGDGVETWEPRFTFQGFRYVKVEGYPGQLTEDDLTAVVIHSDMKPTGHFQTSNALINQLQHNIVWGQKGNFLDIPTDCPQRDERLGWTGDIQVFASTSCLNMDASGFLTKWLRDVDADQLDDGRIPHVVPNVLGENSSGASGWGDASVVVPWTLYQAYGDEQILETQYESMKGWVDYMHNQSQSDSTKLLWDNSFTFGDWLAFTNDPDGARFFPGAYTNTDLISTAFFAHSTDLLRKSAQVLGKEEDARKYSELFEQIKEAFQREYVTQGGRVMSDTQTSYLLALQFGLLPDEMNKKAAAHLAANIDERGHLTTGFLGTPHLNPVLTQYGYSNQAFELLLRKEYPSWLYPVTMGATTIWERWDGIKPDSTFQDPGMNSYNHYAYGAIGEWLYKSVAGIDQASAGYKDISIHPNIGGGLTHATGMLHSMYGKIESSWEYRDGEIHLSVEIPTNTSATVTLPGAQVADVIENGSALAEGNGIHGFSQRGENVEVEIGSGRYVFEWPGNYELPVSDSEEMATLSASSKMGELLADNRSRDILNEHLPQLMNSPWLSQVMGFTLAQANYSLPGDLRADAETINRLKEALIEIG